MRRFCLFLLVLFGVTAFAAGNEAAKADDNAALAALADVLENPAQRKALIAQLRQLNAPEKAATKAETPAADGKDKAEAPAAAADDTPAGDDAAKAEEAAPDKGDAPKDEKQAEAEALKSVAENARAAVVSAAAWPKKVAEAGVQVLREVGTRIPGAT